MLLEINQDRIDLAGDLIAVALGEQLCGLVESTAASGFDLCAAPGKAIVQKDPELISASDLWRVVGNELLEKFVILNDEGVGLLVSVEVFFVTRDEVSTPAAFHFHQMAQHLFFRLKDLPGMRDSLGGRQEALGTFPRDDGDDHNHGQDKAEPEQDFRPNREPAR